MNVQLREGGNYAFGPFRLDPTRRTLVGARGEVNLTARLFDTLFFLVQNSERLVEREELAYAVWGDRTVAEGNLQKAISSLRKALHEHAPDEIFIRTVSGRGFRFAVPVILEPNTAALSLVDPFVTRDASGKPSPQWWRSRDVILLVLLLLAVGLIAIALTFRHRGAETSASVPFSPPAHSVAVMAFTNLSGDPRQDYFSDGISEELINALGRINKLKVAARLSSFSFKGKPVTVADIGRQLDVGAVLEGSVRRDGTRLRITAQLVDVRTGYQLWSRDFDRNNVDVLNVQDDIAEAVAASLKIVLGGDDVVRLTSGNTNNPEAWDAYLRGLGLRNQFTAETLQKALAAFDKAIALDPRFALAHVERTFTMINYDEGFGTLGSDVAAAQRFRAQAFAEAEQAVSLAPRLGVAHAALAAADEELWHFADAEAEYERARALAPGDSTIERHYARFEAAMGHPRAAIAAAQRAVELDPLSAGAYLALASNLTMARRPASDAATALHHAELLAPKGPLEVFEAVQIALLRHDYTGARQLCAAHPFWAQYFLAIADYKLGDREGARAALAKFRAAQGDNSAFQYAIVYAQWGDARDALHWLEAAYRLHDDGLIDMKTFWMLDPIRGTAGFRDIERRMNFPT